MWINWKTKLFSLALLDSIWHGHDAKQAQELTDGHDTDNKRTEPGMARSTLSTEINGLDWQPGGTTRLTDIHDFLDMGFVASYCIGKITHRGTESL